MGTNMDHAAGLLLIALTAPTAAMAQQVPPPALQCGSFEAKDGNGKYGEAIEVQVTRSNATPSMSSDYMIVGGRCDFQAHDAVPDMVRIQWQKPVPDGFSCKAGPAGSTSFVTTVATLYACRVVAQPIEIKPIDPKPTSTKPYGELGVIARRGTGFRQALKYDYRVCNVDAVSGINVAWYDQQNEAPQNGPNAKPVPPGSCMELSGITYIQIQGNPADPTFGVHYNRFPRNSFAPGVRIVAMPPGDPQAPAPGTPPDGATPVKIKDCSDIPSPGSGKDGQTFDRKCPVPLPRRGNYRICFGEKVVDRADDASKSWWPAKFLPMIVDRKLVGVPIKSDNPNDPRWNDVLQNTCRDYYDIADAYVLVGGDKNYRAKDVLAVYMTVAPLK